MKIQQYSPAFRRELRRLDSALAEQSKGNVGPKVRIGPMVLRSVRAAWEPREADKMPVLWKRQALWGIPVVSQICFGEWASDDDPPASFLTTLRYSLRVQTIIKRSIVGSYELKESEEGDIWVPGKSYIDEDGLRVSGDDLDKLLATLRQGLEPETVHLEYPDTE